LRGTFAALGDPAVIDHLRRLGVTTIELLPVQAFLQDRALIQRGLRNYWGYNTLAFFAPEPGYLASGAANEVRIAVRRLHAAGIEVILDVVYNHTAETNETGPTLSFRGLDNASYYRLQDGNARHCVNDTGCATGSRHFMWTDSASTFRRRSDARATGSIREAGSSMRCVRTRCCRG
jgi:glycogen operon protein